ncbi:unnamed protein product [Symbiodinium necroappetens]|uniref:Uncharacterized protein n=1 Tax=Symbiodinium necroappetens TaxID=1628268 RepID=A0A812RWH9_9DINO|nr:unnamed protein product [Symbiodinium necroappetens]
MSFKQQQPPLGQDVIQNRSGHTYLARAMYSLRGCGGNHFGMFAGTRSDFIITQHPEFNLGRVASEQGLGNQWDTSRYASRINRSFVLQRLHESRLQGSPRLRGPREHGLTLKDRALVRAATSPGGMAETPNPEASEDDLFKSMKAFALRKKRGAVPQVPQAHAERQRFRYPQGIGQYNYTVPEQALPFLQKFQRPLVNPPTLPKAP